MLQRNLRLNSECQLKFIQAREHPGLMGQRQLSLALLRSQLRRLRVQEILGTHANILAHLLELGPTERLLFSNAYSALYVMSSDRVPATLSKLLKFIKQEYKNIK